MDAIAKIVNSCFITKDSKNIVVNLIDLAYPLLRVHDLNYLLLRSLLFLSDQSRISITNTKIKVKKKRYY